ncbi:hypothetical protein DPMN_025803 [Dreissena polymorpha]|uniref:Uncharacterized protein n=1 Tax=Dreissena polymorpha TaxID=45954 RepID=A0A9D4RCV7_DREPO|nr:hypothetical protein DPMN_025803 [Dreissena polymorpha]
MVLTGTPRAWISKRLVPQAPVRNEGLFRLKLMFTLKMVVLQRAGTPWSQARI